MCYRTFLDLLNICTDVFTLGVVMPLNTISLSITVHMVDLLIIFLLYQMDNCIFGQIIVKRKIYFYLFAFIQIFTIEK